MAGIAQQLDYKKIEASNPSYRMTKLLPLQSTPAAPNTLISTSGGTETIIELPVVAMNLNKSILHFTLTPPANGAGTYNWMYLDAMNCFQQVQLYNRTGTLLCDLQQPQNYTKVVWKADIPYDQFRNFDTFSNNTGSGRFLRPTNAANGSTTQGFVAVRPDGTSTSMNYIENSYLEVAAANTAGPVLDFSFPLAMIKNSIFDVDKDIFFNEIMILRLVWGPSSKVGYYSNSATNPNSSPIAFNSGCDVQNIYLFLATERNQEIIGELKEEVSMSGFSIPIPFIYSFKTVNSSSTNQSSTLRITRGHGARLLKVYHSLFNPNESSYTAYANTTINGSTTYLQNFYTQIDNYRLQDFNVDLALNTDWAILQRKLEGSITFNSNIYRFNWFWVDDFTSAGPTADESDPTADNRLEGIDLDAEKRYDFIAYMNSPTAFNHYDFVITQKMLAISNAGMSCA